MPTKESVDKKMRNRIRLYLIADMREKGMRPADVVRATRVDKSALGKFLDPHGEMILGLDNFIKLVRGLGLNANKMIHTPHPKENAHNVGGEARP